MSYTDLWLTALALGLELLLFRLLARRRRNEAIERKVVGVLAECISRLPMTTK